MGILLKDRLFVDLEKGRRICIFTNTCERRTKPRSAGFYFHLCLATSSSFFDSAPSRSFPWLPASPHRRREAPSSASPRHREDHRLAVIGRAQAASSATACLCPFVSLALSPAAPWSQLSVQVCGASGWEEPGSVDPGSQHRGRLSWRSPTRSCHLGVPSARQPQLLGGARHTRRVSGLLCLLHQGQGLLESHQEMSDVQTHKSQDRGTANTADRVFETDAG